jgi:hypothetical protein
MKLLQKIRLADRATDNQEEWRRNGLRLQIVSKFVLKRLGYKVVKGQEDFWDDVAKHPSLARWRDRFTLYLKNYADYIVARKRRVSIVDVKAPVSLRIKPNSGPFRRTTITFSKRERDEYNASPVPVATLVWDYNGTKALDEQNQPLFYTLIDFRCLSGFRELAEQVEVRVEPGKVTRHKLSSQVFRRFLEKTRAMDIIRIEPGRIIYR